jgi:hypothetical protein
VKKHIVMFTYLFIQMDIYMYVSIYMYVPIYMYEQIHESIYTQVWTYPFMLIHMHGDKQACIHTCI